MTPAPAAVLPAGAAPIRRVELLVLTVLFTIYFVPKIDVLSIPGFTVAAKPEDLVWLASIPFLLLRPLQVGGILRKAWLLFLGTVAFTVLVHPANLVLLVRFWFYSMPLLYLPSLSGGGVRAIRMLSRAFLLTMAPIAVLQVFTPFPYFHTGELLIGPVDRASGIHGNGVEFALMALFSFWVLALSGERRVWPFIAAFVIVWCTGTRVVTAMLALSALHYFMILPVGQRILLAAAAAAAILLGAGYLAASGDNRFAELDLAAVREAVSLLFGNLQGATQSPVNQDGYCFEFDDALAEDQSFAMRLSKLLFVLEHVVLGPDPLGYGVGQCIGDAGDNLFVRVLSDGGLPLFAALLVLFAGLAIDGRRAGRGRWLLFVAVLAGTSLFYDTLYFSRVAPLILICLALRAGKDSDPRTTRPSGQGLSPASASL